MIEQPSLFARAGDPDTSWAAARLVSNVQEVRGRIVALHHRFGPMTDEELADMWPDDIEVSGSGLRTRRHELVAAGVLVDSGRRRVTRSGRAAVVWELF